MKRTCDEPGWELHGGGWKGLRLTHLREEEEMEVGEKWRVRNEKSLVDLVCWMGEFYVETEL